MIRFFRLVLAAMALAMAALISAVTTMHFAIHGAEVKVPDLQGLRVADAAHETANNGLNLGIDNKYYSVDVPAGRVLAQSPPPGAVVRREWRVRITQSLGPQRVAIPDLIGEEERLAEIEVRRHGLELGETAQMPYAVASAGVVIAQNPESGAAGVERPTLSLLVGTPLPPASAAFVMPQLIGMPYTAAASLIARAGFKLGPMEDVDDDEGSASGSSGKSASATPAATPPAGTSPAGTSPVNDQNDQDDTAVPPGIILTQTPSAGHRVDASTYIALTMSQ